jgi:hypothetical protein
MRTGSFGATPFGLGSGALGTGMPSMPGFGALTPGMAAPGMTQGDRIAYACAIMSTWTFVMCVGVFVMCVGVVYIHILI